MKQHYPMMSLLESKAMLILWKHRTCCVHMVKTELESEKKMAYTTVQTIMERLVNKGMAKKHQVDKTAVYTPVITKAAYAASLTSSLMHLPISQYDEVLVPSLIKGLSLLDKKQLRKITSHFKVL